MMKKLFFLPLFLLMLVFGSAGVVRAAAGDLDTSFGDGGEVTTSFSGLGSHIIDSSFSSDSVITNDGKIIVVGGSFHNSYKQNHTLVKYNEDGSIDTSFGNNGITSFSILGSNDRAVKIIQLNDGRFMVFGLANSLTPTLYGSSIARSIIGADGTLYSKYALSTPAYTGINIHDAKIQPDGKVVLLMGIQVSSTRKNYVVYRFLQNGALDTSFDYDGKKTFGIESLSSDLSKSIAVQPDGKIILGGISQLNGVSRIGLVRLNEDGSNDSSYGPLSNGRVVTELSGFNLFLERIHLDASGKLMAISSKESTTESKGIIHRYNIDGSLDSSFGTNGSTTLDYGNNLRANTFLSYDDTSFLVRRYSGNVNTLYKVGFNGVIDPTFGNSSEFSFTFFNGGFPSRLHENEQGLMLATGFSKDQLSNTYNFALAKYLGGVVNTPPIASAGPDITTNEATQITFDASASTDPDGLEDIVGYDWDFGDGSTGSGVTTNRTYDDNGVFTVTLTVTDTAGETSTDSLVVTVNNIAPTATLTIDPNIIIEGETTSLLLSNIFDPSLVDTTAGFTYSYDCTNDGTFELTNGLLPFYQCSYPTAGTITALARVTDKDGGFTNYTQNIIVQTPAEAIQGMIDLVESFNLQQGIDNSLDAKLDSAVQSLTDLNQNNDQAAINSLQAFINAVEAQRDNKITNEQADELIAVVQRIIDGLI